MIVLQLMYHIYLPENRKTGLYIDVIQINPLSRNNFGQYQASLAAQDTGIKYRIHV